MKGKRILFTLGLLLIVGSMSILEAGVLYQGRFGNSNSGIWEVHDNGTLEITMPNSTEIPNYDALDGDYAPWYAYRSMITKLKIKSGTIGRIGKYALAYMNFPDGIIYGSSTHDNGYLYVTGTLGRAALSSMNAPRLYLCVASERTDFELPSYSLNGNIDYVSLDNVQTLNEWSLEGKHKMIDLGDKVTMIYAGAMANYMGSSELWHDDETPSVFIQSPTPPEWSRLARESGSSLLPRQFDYPFGDKPSSKPSSKIMVVVPWDKLQTYVGFYTTNHPETSVGYMAAYFTGAHDKYGSTCACGEFVAGAPIYGDYGQKWIGWWYVSPNLGTLHVGSNNDGKCPSGANWNSALNSYRNSSSLVRPKTLRLHDITSIPDEAFKNGVGLTGIERIELPRSLESIGREAFYGCTGIKEVVYYDDGKNTEAKPLTVGAWAFAGCTALTKIEGLKFKSFDIAAFEGCTALKEVNYNIKGSFEITIAERAFKGCTQLSKTDLENVVEIGANAFEGTAIKELNLVRECVINGNAFKNCTKLQSINFNDTKKDLKILCFCGCTGIRHIYVGHIPDKTTTVGYLEGAFDSSVEAVLAQMTLHVDYEWANPYETSSFWSQMTISKENMPVNVSGTFNDGHMAWYLDKKSKVLTISPLAVKGNYKNYTSYYYIPDFTSANNQPWYSYRDQIKGIMLLTATDALGKEYGISKIGKNAFAYESEGTSLITDVSIPRACREIGQSAFKNNDRLLTIHIEDVEKIGSYAFENCKTLVRIDLGESLSEAGDYIFRNCPKLNRLKVSAINPAAVTENTFREIGNNQQNNGPLRSPAANPATDGQQNVTLDIPTAALNNYLRDDKWNKFQFEYFEPTHGQLVDAGAYGDGTYMLYADSALIISATKNPTGAFSFNSIVRNGTKSVLMFGKMIEVPEGLFESFENLTSVTLPEDVWRIGKSAFRGCPRLEDFDFSNILGIGENAFAEGYSKDNTHRKLVPGLKNLYLPKATGIGNYAFVGCVHATSVTLAYGAQVGFQAFAGCDGLTALNLGNCNLNAGSVFKDCDNIEVVYFNGSELPGGTFSGCNKLKTVHLGSKIRSIGADAFGGCTALDTIYVNAPQAPTMQTYENTYLETEGSYFVTWTYTPFGYKGVRDNSGEVEFNNIIDHKQIHAVVPTLYKATKYGVADYWKGMKLETPVDDNFAFPISIALGTSGVATIDAQGNLTMDVRGALEINDDEIRKALETYGPFINNSITFTYPTAGIYSKKAEYDIFSWMTKANMTAWGTHAPTTVTFGAMTKYIGPGLFDTDAFSPYNVTFNCYAVRPPEIRKDAFNWTALNAGGDKPELHVIASSLSAYQAKSEWNDHFDIIGDLTAQTPPETYKVAFVHGMTGDTLAVETVGMGQGVTSTPSVQDTFPGYRFQHWTGNYSAVFKDETVVATFAYTTYTVTFMNGDDIYDVQTVPYLMDARKPSVNPTMGDKVFKEWSRNVYRVKSDMTVDAVYYEFVPVYLIEIEPRQNDFTLSQSALGDTTVQLTATVYPSYASDKSLTWTSSDTDVATVDENGVVTIVGFGPCTIKAIANDDSGKEGWAGIKVFDADYTEPVNATAVSIDQPEITITRRQDPTHVLVNVTPDEYDGEVMFEPLKHYVQVQHYSNAERKAPVFMLSAEMGVVNQQNFQPLTDTVIFRPMQYDMEQFPGVWGLNTRLIVHIIDDSIFTENSIEGVPVTYRVTDLENNLCEVYGYMEQLMEPDPVTHMPFVRHPAIPTTATKVTIPKEVRGFQVVRTSMEAFAGCESLQEIEFENGIIMLRAGTFSECPNLAKIILPKSWRYMDMGCCAGLNNLHHVYLRATDEPMSISYDPMRGEGRPLEDEEEPNAFQFAAADATLHVPQGSLATYQKAPWTNWFATITDDLPVTYAVRFVDYDGAELSAQNIEYGEAAVAPLDPMHNGRTFTGWDKTFNRITANTDITATYHVDAITVTFKDWNGTVLQTTQEVYGAAATAPADPTRAGYVFKGWDAAFDHVTEDIVINAVYAQLFTVTFLDDDNTVLKVETVEAGQDATAPALDIRPGYTFAGWSRDITDVQENITVVAQYSVQTFKVTFLDWDGTLIDKQVVEYGQSATAPADPTREGYTFVGWDADFSKVTRNIIVYAVYVEGQGIDYTPVDAPKARKILIDGQMYIMQGNRLYTPTGARVK